MKRLLIMALLAGSAAVATAQSAAGTFSIIPKVGVTIANITDNKLTVGLGAGELKSKYKAGYTLGAEAMYQATPQWALSLGVMYSSLGNLYDDYEELVEAPTEGSKIATYNSVYDYSTTLNYVQVPLMANYYVVKGLALKAGVQLSFLTGATTEYNMVHITRNIETGETLTPYNPDDEQTVIGEYYNESTDAYKKIDVSIPVGLSYEYMNVVLDARYNIGLTKLYKATDSKNRFFSLTVGYKFNL